MAPDLCPHCGTSDCVQTASFATVQTARIADLQASIWLLGRGGKPERERHVVRELLLNLGQLFNDADIVSVAPNEDPPDVLFDMARFEVKEIFDQGREREREFKAALQGAQQALTCAELFPLEEYTPIDIALADVLSEAEGIGLAHSQRYDTRLVPTLDLLLYHNRIDVMGLTTESMPSTVALCAQGWRSVSVVWPPRDNILCNAGRTAVYSISRWAGRSPTTVPLTRSAHIALWPAGAADRPL